MTYACLTCVLIFVLLVLLECPAILVSAGQAGQKSGQTGHLVTLFGTYPDKLYGNLEPSPACF